MTEAARCKEQESRAKAKKVNSSFEPVASSSNKLFHLLPLLPTIMSFNKANESLTPTGTPTMNSTKRLSTIKTPGSPKTGLKTGAGAGGGGVKDVVSPGELCGFVRDFYSYFYYYFVPSSQIMGLVSRLRNNGVHVGGWM